jgi:transcriptional regulator with XRE-family HTH domain
MSLLHNFGLIAKDLRLTNKLGIRKFCKKHGFEPANISKIERGQMCPPLTTLTRYAVALGLIEGSKEFRNFYDLAYLCHGMVPTDILEHLDLVRKLPAVFEAIRKNPTSKFLSELCDLITAS